MLPKKSLFLTGTICGVLAIFLIGFLLLNLAGNSSTGLTAEQKKAIFAAIIKNNSGNFLGRNSGGNYQTAAEIAPAADTSNKLLAPLIYRPDNKEYNYRYTKVTYTNGAAVAQCKFFNYSDDGAYINESYEFYGNDNNYYSKYISKDSTDQLSSYTLTKTTAKSSTTTEFRGGKYAVQWDYSFAALSGREVQSDATAPDTATDSETPVSAPTKDPDTPQVDEDDLISQYFGADADIVDVVKEDGKTYYLVQYSYEADCSQDSKVIPLLDPVAASDSATNQDTKLNKIIVQNMVNAATFEIAKNSNYLEKATSDALLNSYVSVSDNQNTTFAKVSSNFKFDYDVTVKKLVYPKYDANEEAQNLVNYLKKQDLTILQVSGATLTSAYSNPAYQEQQAVYNYLYDRNFYPVGGRGDQMYSVYSELGDQSKAPILSTYYVLNPKTTYDSVGIDVYKSINLSDLVKGDGTESEKMNINIDGKDYQGTLYTISYAVDSSNTSTGSGSSDAPVVDVPPDRGDYKSQQLYLEFRGLKYLIVLPSRDGFAVSSLKFKTIDTGSASDMESFSKAIKATYTGGVSKPGSSGSGSSSGSGTNSVEPDIAPDAPVPSDD